MKKTKQFFLKTGLIIFLFGCAGLNAATELNVAYDRAFQEIDGFGASDAWSINPTINKWQSEGKQAAALKEADLHSLVGVDGAEVVEYSAALSDAYKVIAKSIFMGLSP